jgi:hypothetical protein
VIDAKGGEKLIEPISIRHGDISFWPEDRISDGCLFDSKSRPINLHLPILKWANIFKCVSLYEI